MNKRATIEDVARIAGVSIATVSRVIHTPKKVSDSTRTSVHDAITKTGYTLNQAARNLRQQRANAIIVLVPDIGNTFFSEILSGIERAASAAGQTILIGHTANDPIREEQYLNALINGQADGALLLNGHLPEATTQRIKAAPSRTLPIVSLSEALEDQIVPHVGIDNVEAAACVTKYLLSKGHRDILHLKGPPDNILTRQRTEGFMRAMSEAGLDRQPEDFLEGDFTIESGLHAAQDLVARRNLPDAIFCANDESAIGLMSGLAERGIRVPVDISVAGFDDIAFSRTATPPLTTIRQPRAKIGEQAMNLLLELLSSRDMTQNDMLTLPFELIERASVKPSVADAT